MVRNFLRFTLSDYYKDEIGEHKDKILKISGFTDLQFLKAYETITKRITFVDEILISDKELLRALDLVADIDENDTLFIALTNHINGKLWTGDKKLISGLQKKRYQRTISTDDLYEQYILKQTTMRRKKK